MRFLSGLKSGDPRKKLLNLKDFMNWKPSVVGGHQIAIYTPEAAKIFNSGLQAAT
jgi:hypothetical protein